MNKTKVMILGVLTLITVTATPLLAQDSKAANSGGHSHFTKIPATGAEIWTEIHKQQAKLVATVNKKRLADAHDHAFAIRDLVKALPDKVNAENKAKAEDGAKEISKLASEIDKAAAGKAQKATEEKVKEMGTAVTALEAKLKAKQ